MSKAKEYRRDNIGPKRKMAEAEGYVMVRRPGSMAHVMALEDWLTLPLCDHKGNPSAASAHPEADVSHPALPQGPRSMAEESPANSQTEDL